MIVIETTAGGLGENSAFYQLWRHRTEHVIWYNTDGSIQEFDLTDAKTPLPRWRSVAVLESRKPVK